MIRPKLQRCRKQPLTIGRLPPTRLAEHRWWQITTLSFDGRTAMVAGFRLNSPEGTFSKVNAFAGTPTKDGDEISLGRRGPVLVFRLPQPPAHFRAFFLGYKRRQSGIREPI